MASESNAYFGVDCSYTKTVSYEIESKLQLNNLWVGDTVEHCLKTWCSEEELKDIRYLPLIVFGLIWKARNQCWFEYQLLFPIQVSIQSLGVMQYIPHDLFFIKTRLIAQESIDK